MLLGNIIGGASSLAGIATGLFQSAKARRLEKQTVRPIYKTPSEVLLNQNLAQKQAQQGMGGQQYSNNLMSISRNLSAGLDTLNRQRSGASGIGNLVAMGNDAALNLDAQDDAIKRENMNAYIAQNQNVADYKDKAFQYNEADKYAETMNKIAQMRGSANANISNGITSLTKLGMSMAQQQKEQ